MHHWLKISSIIWITFATQGVSLDVSPAPTEGDDESSVASNCYAEAVYDELIKVIDIVKAHTYSENDKISTQPQLKKFQEDEDYVGGIDGGLDVQNIVPMIFKLVGSAIALNSSGLVEGSFGLLPEGLSNRITNVLGIFAHNILGPGVVRTTTVRPRRRRRTTTTAVPTTSETVTESSTILTTPSESTHMAESLTKINSSIGEGAISNNGSTADEKLPTTTDVLFKQSSLGELPVYAAAYAPNYVQTTHFPVYANNYLHVLYPAPASSSTSDIGTTSSTSTTTEGTTTSTDPNSYAIALPFDYQEGIGIGTGLPPIVGTGIGNLVDLSGPPNTTSSSPLQYTPPEYSEYEYEEQTEEAKFADRNDNEASLMLQLKGKPGTSADLLVKVNDSGENNTSTENASSSLSRIVS